MFHGFSVRNSPSPPPWNQPRCKAKIEQPTRPMKFWRLDNGHRPSLRDPQERSLGILRIHIWFSCAQSWWTSHLLTTRILIWYIMADLRFHYMTIVFRLQTNLQLRNLTSDWNLWCLFMWLVVEPQPRKSQERTTRDHPMVEHHDWTRSERIISPLSYIVMGFV